MKTNDALFLLVQNSRNQIASLLARKGPFSKEYNTQVRSMLFRIKDNLSIDYCRQIEIKDIEIEVLENLIQKYLKNGEDLFDKHFLLLLCWNIHKIKPIKKTINGKKTQLSFFEYQPGLLEFNPATRKIFNLLSKHNEYKEQISAALMMIYLNNYNQASEFYIFLLKNYLRSVKFSRNLKLFFDVVNAGSYGRWRVISPYYKSFLKRLDLFQIRSSYINTKYFQDAWYFWMKKRADVSNKTILEDLPCRFYDVCSDAEKLLILSRCIAKNYDKGKNITDLISAYLEDLFPIDPHVPENWIFDCNEKEISQLIYASNIFQKAFVENPEMMKYEVVENEIKIYRY